MSEKEDRLAREREEIAARVARFKATQQKFEREREEYYATTLGQCVERISPAVTLDVKRNSSRKKARSDAPSSWNQWNRARSPSGKNQERAGTKPPAGSCRTKLREVKA